MKKITLFILFTLFVFNACKKDPAGITTNEENIKYAALTANMGSLDYPSLQNGMLKFRDHEHYEVFNQQLEVIENNSDIPGSTDTVTFEEKLNAIEVYLGFTSIRRQFYIDEEQQNEVGWSSIDLIPSLDIPLGDISLSLLNQDMNLMIGDTLYNYFNDSTLLKVSEPSNSDISTIRDANNSLDNLEPYSKCVIVQNLTNCKITSNNSSYKTLGDTTWGGIIRLYKDDNSSNNPKKCGDPNFSYEIFNDGMDFTTGGVGYWLSALPSIDYYIDWGDGNIVTGTASSSLNGNSWNFHTYQAEGNYTIEVKYRPTGYNYYPIERTYLLEVPKYSCAQPYFSQNKIVTGRMESPDGSRCVRGEIKCYRFYLSNVDKMKAKSWGYKKKNGKWKKRKMDVIKVRFDTDVLYAYNCAHLYPLPASKTRNNKKKAKCKGHFTLGSVPQNSVPNWSSMTYSDLAFEEVISKHEVNDGGAAKTAKLTLTLRACEY